LEETLPDFIEGRRNNISPSTASTYTTALRRFLHYLDDHETLDPDSPTPLLADCLDVLLRYADFLAQSGLSESTYTLYLTALGQWLDYLFEADLLDDGVTATDFQRLRKQLRDKTNVSLKSANLKPERERRAPGAKLIERFLLVARRDRAADRDASPAERRRSELRRLRNVALVETLVSTGARIGEVVGLNVGDLLDDQAAHIRRGVGKGDKSRVVFFDDRAWFALQAYIGETGAAHGAAPIFLRHDRGAGSKIKRISEKGAQAVLRRLRSLVVLDLCEDLVRLLLTSRDPMEDHIAHLAGKLAEDDAWPEGLSRAQRDHPELTDEVYALRMQIRQAREVTAHSFRHALGTTLLEETGDLAAVQDLLGHADPGTTRRYSRLSDERLRQVHREGLRRS
jgi:site-specific recombinase XerD